MVIGGAAVAMLVTLGFNLGPRGLAVGLTAAVLPVPVLVACFLWLDRYEPEPVTYLLFAFGWGAAPATYAAYHVNTFAADYLELPESLVGVLVAPFIEELMKALGPLLILWTRRRAISGFTDGIVYCGLSGVGFAMVENILYLGGHAFNAGYEQYGPASGTALVFGLFIARIFMSGFAHPLFTSMTGIGIGFAARSASGWVRALAPIPGLILAMMLHGAWNLMAILSASRSPYVFLYGYVAVMVPVFLTMLGIALWVRAHEGRLALKVLPPYVRAGWFTPPEVAALGTLGRRHAARVWAKRVAGDTGQKGDARLPVRRDPARARARPDGPWPRRSRPAAGDQPGGGTRAARSDDPLAAALRRARPADAVGALGRSGLPPRLPRRRVPQGSRPARARRAASYPAIARGTSLLTCGGSRSDREAD